MYFYPAVRRELRRIAFVCFTGTLLLTAVMGQISGFDPGILIGALGGCAAAVGNFALMCITIQKAVGIENSKARQAFIQGSYNARLLLQAGWVAAAFAIPHINVFAASLPLLFPGLILFLRRNGNKKTN